jgi:ElaB/YqjD/DUF883 family membrane-anchored ribosome-binding protein
MIRIDWAIAPSGWRNPIAMFRLVPAGIVLQPMPQFDRQRESAELSKVGFRRRRWRFFRYAREEAAMNETSDSLTNMNGPGATTGMDANVVRRVAQKAHETVDRLEQTVSTGSERMMTMQEEYGSYAREQIKMHPLSTVAGAFAVGWLLGKIMR